MQIPTGHVFKHYPFILEGHAGVGSDFDGGGGVPGFNGSEDFTNVARRLQEQGYNGDDISKVLGGNYLRVLSEIQAAANDPRLK